MEEYEREIDRKDVELDASSPLCSHLGPCARPSSFARRDESRGDAASIAMLLHYALFERTGKPNQRSSTRRVESSRAISSYGSRHPRRRQLIPCSRVEVVFVY